MLKVWDWAIPNIDKKVFSSSRIIYGSPVTPFTVSSSVGIVFFLLLEVAI